MNKTLLAVAAVAVAASAPTMASAAIEEFKFNSADITAMFSIDVVGGQAVNGGGELWSPYWSGPASMAAFFWPSWDRQYGQRHRIVAPPDLIWSPLVGEDPGNAKTLPACRARRRIWRG